MLKEGSIFKLEIGSDDLCNIVYKNRFVTGSHAEITFESGAAYITDKKQRKWHILKRQAGKGENKAALR